MALAGMAARYNLLGIDTAGTHVTGQITYWDKNGNTSTMNSVTSALGLTALLSNLNLCSLAAADCNTNFGTSWAMSDVALAGGFVTL